MTFEVGMCGSESFTGRRFDGSRTLASLDLPIPVSQPRVTIYIAFVTKMGYYSYLEFVLLFLFFRYKENHEGRSHMELCCQELRDADLIKRLLKREHLAMVEVIGLYSRRTFLAAMNILRSRAEAEDVTQDVLIQLWFTPHLYTSKGSLGGWLALVARNRAIDIFRKRSRMACLEDVTLTADCDILHRVEKLLEFNSVQLTIGQLPTKQQEALQLAFCEDYSYPEIAVIIGVPLGTVKTRIRDGLANLRKQLAA